MADKTMWLQNETGKIARQPIGFSWTLMFFGWTVPLWRGEYLIALIALLLHIGGLILGPMTLVILLGISAIYNKHISYKWRISQGYYPIYISGIPSSEIPLDKELVENIVKYSDYELYPEYINYKLRW